jgi:hypothetical protein
MTTVLQAVERARENESWPPRGPVGLRALLSHFSPTPAGSARALLAAMSNRATAKKPWAVILCRFKGDPPDASREGPVESFFRTAFTPGSGGLVEYWRDASLSSVDITGSRVFDWVEVDIPRAQAGGRPNTNPPGPGRSGLIDAGIRALQQRQEDPLTGFHSQITVYTRNWAKDGAPPGADWSTPGWGQFWIDGSADGRGKVNLTPPFDGSIAAHEMGHGFGMEHDVGSDLTTATDYADPCCIMSQNGPFLLPPWDVAFGPAVCFPHLSQQSWMYSHRVYTDGGQWMTAPNGITIPLAPITSPGARASLGIRLRNASANPNWDYYLEYVVATEWNRGVQGMPYLLIRRLVNIPGTGVRPAYLDPLHVARLRGATAELVEPSGNVRFHVEVADLSGPIVMVTAQAQ